MSYTVFARKYRPQTFDDLVGQEHVARTLKNAIESDRVAHAFLFTGVRGVGKTTSARLLAKCLNCETGPTAAPCNECDICKDITLGADMDVLEIDGASNNSVEDVRRLQETLPFQPSRDRFKVVIVDEVHMLSTGAFNAFLKTLEEPPAHVKFIFATTEAHKVPITIRSRCQRYDFRLIPQGVIAGAVRDILDKEGIGADDATVALVAREAAGSMRDALTLLDQIVAFSAGDLVGREVAKTLGIAGRDGVQRAARAILEGDGVAALECVNQLANQGLDMLHFAKQLLAYLRDLTVLQVTAGNTGELLDLVDEERAVADEIIAAVDGLEIQRAFSGLSRVVDEMARAASPRTALEMGLVRLATRPRLQNVAQLLARIDALESGGPPARPPGRSRPDPGRPAQPGKGASAERPTSSRPRTQTSTPTAERPAAERPAPAQPAATRPAASSPAAERPAAERPAPAVDVPASPEGTLATWERIVAQVRDSKPALAAVLEHGRALEVSREKIVIGFTKDSFFGQQADSKDGREGIADGAANVVGARPAVEIRFVHGEVDAGPTVAQIESERRTQAVEERRQRALNHPRVLEAQQIFPEGAGKIEVRLDGE